MKELSKQRATEIHDKHWEDATPMREDITMLQEAYRLGQQEAGADDQRFRAACAAMQGMLSAGVNVAPQPDSLAMYALSIADALLAELNRTAEKGGEHE